ncbi:hypothetical protein VNO80_17843 [Phaseolus coccineus]|uniref:Uncharacterized protein n=1 Tax=Phaseolus coccineus TaxID=3886 RepID=A0AAN9ME69_PHACN
MGCAEHYCVAFFVVVARAEYVSDEYDHKPVIVMDYDERSELGFEYEELVHHSKEDDVKKGWVGNSGNSENCLA